MPYGQGMVRPGCWWSKDWAEGRYLDRQYRIATGVYSFHYDIKSFRDQRGWSMEASRDLGSLFVATSPDLSAVWWSPTIWRGTHANIEPVWCPVLSESWGEPANA